MNNEEMNLRDIKQICPECRNEFIIKDFDLFLNKIRDSWALASTRFRFEELPEEQKISIRRQNREEYILQTLAKGYVKIVCQPCSALFFYDSLKEVKP